MKKPWIRQVTVVVLVWMTYMFSFVDRLSWPPVIPLASKEMGLTAAHAGSYMTAFYIGYVITQFPGGVLTDRFGYRKVLLSSYFIMGIFTFTMSTVHSFEQGFVFRLLAGLGSGAIFSASLAAIFDHISPKRRGVAIGFFMTATSLGVTVVNLFVPTVAAAHGWRSAFIVAGLLPIAGIVLSFFFLKESKRDHGTKKSVSSMSEILNVLKNKNLILAGIAGFGGLWATWGTATWANAYLNHSLHLSLVSAGRMMAVYGMAGLLCKPLIGFVSDYVNKKTIAFWALFLFAPVLVWFGVNTHTGILFTLTAVLGVTAFIYSPVMTAIIGELVEERLVGTAMGLVNAIWQLGSLISPLVVGMVVDATSSYFYGFLVLAAGPLMGAIVMLFVKIKSKQAEKLKAA
ncbi:Sugar phosphate permease [Bacillus sp. OV194]|nr:Sugar phosphate permease [Bacillus sp. OV194]